MHEADFLVIGGGLFGVYTALYLAQKNYRVYLIEKEPELFKKASIVNQARLHGGYHYPRSIGTALMAHEYKERFVLEHMPYINSKYDSYYAVDKSASLTSSSEFERFCQFINIPAKRVRHHPLFNFEYIEALYLTEEYSFDPVLIANHYKAKITTHKNISILLNAEISRSEKMNEHWIVSYRLMGQTEERALKATTVVNATYAGTNSINALFDMKQLELIYELSEIALVRSPEFNSSGLTVVDGPFASCMPYGLSGLMSLSSVTYTHHKRSSAQLPQFDCQRLNRLCRPDFISDCNQCAATPLTNQEKMIEQIKKYLADQIILEYMSSLFAIKTKLKSNYVDDGRPTEISRLNDHPAYFCLFSGKINSIYEIEKLISHAV